MRFFIATIIYVLTIHIIVAQKDSCRYSVSGKVISLEHKEILCFSEVIILETGMGVAADQDGNYRIADLCPGKYTLECRHIGFEIERQSIEIKNKHVHHSFYLKSSVAHLEEAHVEAHVDKRINIQSETVLDEHDLDRTKGLNLGESLKKIPGITTLNTGSTISKPMIHGLHSKRVLIMNNGVRLEGQQWGSEHGPEVDPFMAGKITIVKGAAGVRYGSDAVGGVILVDPFPLVSPPGIKSEIHLVGQLNGYSGAVSAMIEGCIPKTSPFTWRFQGTYKRGGDLRAPDYFLNNTGLEEYNFSAGLGYNKAKFGFELYYTVFNTRIGILEASHFGNLTDLELAIQSPVPLINKPFTFDIGKPYQFITHQTIKGKGYWRTGENSKLEFTLAFQDNNRREFDKHKPIGSSAPDDEPSMQLILQSLTLDIGWNHKLGKKWNGIVGISGLYQTNRWFYAFLIPSFRNVNSGVYWIERFQVNEKVELEAGARFDYNFLQVYKNEGGVLTKPEFHFYNASFNVGAVLHLHHSFHVRFNYGSSWRPPHVSELYSDGVHHGSATYEIGDDHLKPERAHNFNLTFNFKAGRFKGEVTGYYYYIQDFIYLQPVFPPTLTIRGAFPTFKYQSGNVDLKGLDVDLEVNLTKRLVADYKMMLLWAWNYSDNDWLVLMPPGRFQLGLSYYFKDLPKLKNTYISMNGMFMDKQWRTPEAIDYLPAPDAYFLFGLDAGTSFMIGNQQLDVSLSVSNLFDASYRDYLNRFRYFSDEMGRNIVLRIKWPFQTFFKN